MVGAIGVLSLLILIMGMFDMADILGLGLKGPKGVLWFWFYIAIVFGLIGLVVWGFLLLRRVGGSRPSAEVGPAFNWEQTGELVTTEIYHYIRHPMYSSLFFLGWGAFLKSVTASTLILTAVASLALLATAKAEEKENLSRFGEAYRDYMQRSCRFVPFLW